MPGEPHRSGWRALPARLPTLQVTVTDQVRAARALCRGNRTMTGLVIAGLILRALTVVAYRPAIVFTDGMAVYLPAVHSFDSVGTDPIGYDLLLLRPLLQIGRIGLGGVVMVQHVIGVGMAIVLYALLVRKRVWRPLAAVATAPVLLDAYQLEIEHNIMPDLLFQALLVAGFTILVWWSRPGWPAVLAAGLILGAAVPVRLVGAPVLVIALVYLVVTHRSWPDRLTLGALMTACFLLPTALYLSYTALSTGQASFSKASGAELYGRVATFVDCDIVRLPSFERALCPIEPLGLRHSPDWYAHNPGSPLFHYIPPPGSSVAVAVADFSRRAVRAQPLDLAVAVARDAGRLLTWNHDNLANPDAPTERWRFQDEFPTYPDLVTVQSLTDWNATFGNGPPATVRPAAWALRGYQLSVGYTPGPLQALALLLALVAGLGWGPARARGELRAAVLLFGGAAVVILGSADAFEFTWRYMLPGLVLVPTAGAVAATAVLRRDPRPAFPEHADLEAIASFDARYGSLRGHTLTTDAIGPAAHPDVVVVIAAYNEAEALPAVLAEVPRTCGGLRLATLVVVDGATDATAEVARRHADYACAVSVNRGQGAALRLGYYLARRSGARYLVTTDADGQYDLSELARLLRPLIDGEADFVTGSRVLGHNESTDAIRRAGTRFFAWLVTRLTGHQVTDTSFGLRAMRAEVTGVVRLDQPQYQSSELLVGLLGRGYRVREEPMTMRVRRSGRSKKGNNLRYGWRYTIVVLTTWLRERSATARAAGRQAVGPDAWAEAGEEAISSPLDAGTPTGPAART